TSWWRRSAPGRGAERCRWRRIRSAAWPSDRVSPPVEAGPGLDFAVLRHRLVHRVLGSRRAGVVRQDAQPRADRKARGDVGVDAVAAGDDAMLLVRAFDD